jgi:hypothetical protein
MFSHVLFSFFFGGGARFFIIIFGEMGPPVSTFCLDTWTDLIPKKKKKDKNRDLGFSKILNIDEVDGLYLASPEALDGAKPRHQTIF